MFANILVNRVEVLTTSIETDSPLSMYVTLISFTLDTSAFIVSNVAASINNFKRYPCFNSISLSILTSCFSPIKPRPAIFSLLIVTLSLSVNHRYNPGDTASGTDNGVISKFNTNLTVISVNDSTNGNMLSEASWYVPISYCTNLPGIGKLTSL